MTRSRLALGAALLTATSFAAGHLTASLDTNPRAIPASTVPRTAPPSAQAVVPKPDRPEPNGFHLGSPSDCGFGGTCLAEKYLLMPLRG